MDNHAFLIALLLTTLAGLSTGIGSLIAFLTKSDNRRILSWALGLSASVMTYISFMEMLPEAMSDLGTKFGDKPGSWWALVSFFAGMVFIAVVDRFVPEHHTPRETDFIKSANKDKDKLSHLKRQGIMLAMAIAIHNFPEGMATFVSVLDGWNIALPILLAIAIHNIPIGIAISVPIYQATGSRMKAIGYSLLSGLAEPAGALAGGLLLMSFWTPVVNGIILAAAAGIMVYISLAELLPGAYSYGYNHSAVGGLMLGFLLMAISLQLF